MEKILIGNRECLLYSEGGLQNLIIEPVDDHDLSIIDNQITLIKQMSDIPFSLLAIKIDDWNKELSPWPAKAIFGDEDFTGEANIMLDYIIENIIPEYKESDIYLCGYSLAGLFSLWSGFIHPFKGIGAVSGSFWYPELLDYIKDNTLLTDKVYLSLGDKEKKSRNQILAGVEKCMDEVYEMLHDKCICKKELNSGNHFVDNDLRMAKAISWLLNNQ